MLGQFSAKRREVCAMHAACSETWRRGVKVNRGRAGKLKKPRKSKFLCGRICYSCTTGLESAGATKRHGG